MGTAHGLPPPASCEWGGLPAIFVARLESHLGKREKHPIEQTGKSLQTDFPISESQDIHGIDQFFWPRMLVLAITWPCPVVSACVWTPGVWRWVSKERRKPWRASVSSCPRLSMSGARAQGRIPTIPQPLNPLQWTLKATKRRMSPPNQRGCSGWPKQEGGSGGVGSFVFNNLIPFGYHLSGSCCIPSTG